MKITTLMAAIILMAFSMAATADGRMEFCAQYEQAAEDIMTGRQYGMRMSEMVAAASGNDSLVSIIKSAYEWPIQADEDGKRFAIDEFTNAIYSGCIS